MSSVKTAHVARKPLFTREDFLTESRILSAAAVLMDQRTSNARIYRKLAAMLVFADVHMPSGLPRQETP